MRERLLLIAVIIFSIVISTYLIYSKNSLEQNEEFFHSKMLLSVKDLPQGFIFNYYYQRKTFEENFDEEAKKLDWKGGHYVSFSKGYGINYVTIEQLTSVYGSGDINKILGIVEKSWSNSSVGRSGEQWTFERMNVPENAKSIGDSNLIFIGNSSVDNVSLKAVSFHFTKGSVYQVIEINTPSELVSIDELIRLAKIIENLTYDQ